MTAMATIRQELIELLQQGSMNCREISQALSIPEKEVYGHLAHLDRSAKAKGLRLEVDQPRCHNCGYSFSDRQRFTRPGRCPECRKSHLTAPAYRLIR